MSEIPYCTRCERPIDIDTEEYLILNWGQVLKPEKWLYAHADCQRKWKNDIDSESPRVFRRLFCLSQAAMADSSRWR